MAEYTSTVELKANTSKLERSMKNVSGRIDTMNTKLRGASGQFKKTSTAGVKSLNKLDKKVSSSTKLIRTMSAAFSAVAIGMFVTKSLKEFARFEDGIKQIGTLGVTELDKVEKAIFKTAKAFGTDANEAAKGYYDIISAGAKDAAAAQTQLVAASKLSKAGNTDLGKAVDLLTTSINVFGDNGETATTIIDKIFTTVKLGKTTVEELGQSFGLVAATADAAGVSLSEVGAGLAVMTAGGLSTSTAVTGLKAALSNVIKVTPKAEKAAAALGIEFTQAALASKGIVGFFDDIKQKTGGSVVELGKLFDSVEAINAVSTLTSDVGIAKLTDAMDAMKNSAGTVDKAWSLVGDSLSVLFKRVMNTMAEVSHSITSLVIGPIKLMLKSILANGEGWITFKKILVGVTGAAVAFMAAFAVSKIKAITIGVLSLTKAMLMNPLFLVGGIAGFAIVKLFDKVGGFTEGFGVAFDRMHVIWTNWMAGFKKNSIVKAILGTSSDIIDAMKSSLGGAYDFAVGLNWSKAWDKLEKGSAAAFAVTSDAYAMIAKPVKKAYDYLAGLDWSAVWGEFKESTESLYKVTSAAYEVIADPIQRVYDKVSAINWDTMWGGLQEGIQEVKDWFYEMYIYLVGNSVVPDMVREIGEWFDKLVDMVVVPAKAVYDGATKWFDLMYTNITGTTRNTVDEVNTILADVHGFETTKKGMFDIDPDKLENLKKVLDNVSTTFKVIGGIAIAAFSIAIISKFGKSASRMFDTMRGSASTVSGKQGLMNRMLFGVEGGSRRAFGDISKLRKETRLLDQGVSYRAATTAAEKKAALKGYGILERQQIKRNATLNTSVLKSQSAARTAEINKLGANLRGRGMFSRALFGTGDAAGILTKTKLLVTRSGAAAGGLIAKGFKYTRGFLDFAVFGKGGTTAIGLKMSAMVASVKASALALSASVAKTSFAQKMLYGANGNPTKLLAGWRAFSASVGKNKFKIAGVAAAGVAATALYGASGGTEAVTEKWNSFLTTISFDSLLASAKSGLSEYGTEGLMMWAMFGAPGSGAIMGGISKAFTGLTGMLSKALAPAIAYLSTTGAAMLSGPVGWIALGLAAAAIATYAFWPKIEPMFTDMWNGVKTFFTDIDWSGLWDGFVDSITAPLLAVKNAISSAFTFSEGERVTGGATRARGNRYAKGGYAGMTEYSTGGSVLGEGTGTSDSIPAMLSNGEYVINAKATSKHKALLKSLNENKFAKGGQVGSSGDFRNENAYAAFSSGSQAAPSLQFTEGKVDFAKTMDLFSKFVKKGSSEMRIFRGNMETLRDSTFDLTEEETKQLPLAKKLTNYINIHAKAHDSAAKVSVVATEANEELAKATAQTAKDVQKLRENLVTLDESLGNTFAGAGKSLTTGIIDSMNAGNSFGTVMMDGFKGLMSSVTDKLVTRGLEPLESGIDAWIKGIDPMQGASTAGQYSQYQTDTANTLNAISAKTGRSGTVVASAIGQQTESQSGFFGNLSGSLGGMMGSISSMGGSVMSAISSMGSSLMSSLGGMGGGGGDGMGDIIKIGMSLFGFSKGGEITKRHHYATGGAVHGSGSGTSDSIMARLSNGEFVVNAKAAQANMGLLKAINGGNGAGPTSNIPKYAQGGSVNGDQSGGNGDIHLTVENHYDVQSAMNAQEFQAMLVNNADLSFLSVEKKLKETGRSLYK